MKTSWKVVPEGHKELDLHPLSFICALRAANKHRDEHKNHNVAFLCHLIPAKYFTDTDNWIVIGFLCAVNERRQGEVDAK